jgi:predicted small lipoprotein YifL
MKKIILIMVVMLMFTLTGCIHKYQLSEADTEVAAEYMAGLLLDQDENYKPDLLDREELAAGEPVEENTAEDTVIEPTTAPDNGDSTTQTEENSGATGEAEDNFTIAEVIGTKDFDIQYEGYKLCDVYPEDESNAYFSLTPLKGNQLLVASFTVKNITSEKKRLDLRKSEVAYQLDINVGTIYKPLLTLLENNLKYIDITIGAGKKESVLLIFEVSKDIDINNINLIISNGAKTEIIEIK